MNICVLNGDNMSRIDISLSISLTSLLLLTLTPRWERASYDTKTAFFDYYYPIHI